MRGDEPASAGDNLLESGQTGLRDSCQAPELHPNDPDPVLGGEMINAYQRILLDTYEGGEFSHVTTAEEAKGVGDTLFTFLFFELADEEDCDTINTACARVDNAMSQLSALYDKLNKASYIGVV